MIKAKFFKNMGAMALTVVIVCGSADGYRSREGGYIRQTVYEKTRMAEGSSPGESKRVGYEIKPNVKEYIISDGLKNVENIDQFTNLTPEQIKKIAENGFVVSPTAQEQLFYIYEDNTYKKIPSFITTDSVLQVYHIFFDYILRTSERESFLPSAIRLNENMLNEMMDLYAGLTNPVVKEQALTVIGYFGVARLLFGETLPEDFPAEIKSIVESEAEKALEAVGHSLSPLLESSIDYSLFTPRGHYTRSDELTNYFRGMSWYGVVPFPFYTEEGRDTNNALRALIMAVCLYDLPNNDGLELWQAIYSATSFMVGDADDVTPEQLYEIVREAFDTNANDINLDLLTEKMDDIYKGIDELEKPKINSKNSMDETGIQLRFMGQRYIPDSEILQELVSPILRPFPSGLDVLSVLGSKRAMELLAQIENPAEAWPEYNENFDKMSDKFQNLPDEVWKSNIYFSWLDMLRSLIGEYGEGYPMFMKNSAWLDKSISTALGSWAEMRHDTILYGKQSAAECGGGLEAPVIYGYVEPNVDVYDKLLRLTAFTREQLMDLDLLPTQIEYKMQDFEQLLTFLLECSITELEGEMLSATQYDQFLTYGGWLEYMTTSLSDGADKWFMIENETDKNMAVIADVHTATDVMTGKGYYLEVGVGTAAEIYVVYPVGDKLYLGRGAIFDYYEFKSEKRLTDEEWQKNGYPERPSWTESFISPGDAEVPTPVEPYSTGC